MKISLNWLRDFVDIPSDINAQQLGALFTLRTAEVEGIEDQAKSFEKIVVGQILEVHPHPNADKLHVTKVSIGPLNKEPLQIVCGGTNLHEGQYVAIALIGAKVHIHGEEDEPVIIQKAKIRDIESQGMICAAEEIGIEPPPGGGERPILDLSASKPLVGSPLSEIMGKDDIILTIDNKSLTHRPDLWGHYGIAREVAAITKKNLKPIKTSISYPSDGTNFSVEVKNKKLCPRLLAVGIEGIKIEPSPPWMQKRLKASGYRPINNIVDITNYVMAELGQPTHAFDAAKIEGGIIVRQAKKGEEIITLDGKGRKLESDMVVIADHKKPLDIAGIMGGADSEISPSTNHIIMTAANFNPSSVRKTSVKIGLRTEAVQRFEKSLDPNLAEQAMDRICELILEYCPGTKIVTPKIDVNNSKIKKTVVKLDLKKVYSKIGKEIPTAEIVDHLSRLEFGVEQKGKSKLAVTIPTFRATKDINIEDDLVEEIARMHGYENIEEKLPELPTKLPIENRERKLKHIARQILSWGLGFDEVYNYSFYSLKDIRKALLPEEMHEKIQNSLSEDQTHLRVSLIPNMLKNVALNLKNYDHFKIYEIGRTYENLQEYFPIEEKKICGMIIKNKKEKQEAFYEAKGALEKFLQQFRLAGVEMRKGESLCPYAHPNRYAGYFLKKNEQEIARVFELHPLVAKNYDAEGAKIGVFEIHFTKLVLADKKELKYRPLPRFPAIHIDISVIIDKKTEIETIKKTILESDKKLIRAINLFDIYEGQNIPEGKKALAFKIELRADDRTLTDQEMKNIQQTIFEKLQGKGGEIRGLK